MIHSAGTNLLVSTVSKNRPEVHQFLDLMTQVKHLHFSREPMFPQPSEVQESRDGSTEICFGVPAFHRSVENVSHLC